jgi:hypothetical protein
MYIYHNSIIDKPQNIQSSPSFNKFQSVKKDEAHINQNNIKYGHNIIKDSGTFIIDEQQNKLNNNINNITIDHSPRAIREFKFNINTGKFNSGYPNTIVYPLCNQKVSTVFINGNTSWTNSTINNTTSFPMQNPLSVVEASNNNDCVECIPIDYTGEYVLNWSASQGAQLLSSTNSQVVLGTFSYHVNDDYFEIFLYPTLGIKNNSYIHIRYRVPIRWRHSYNDWTFWENVIINGEMSNTEFIRIVNCCNNFSYVS